MGFLLFSSPTSLKAEAPKALEGKTEQDALVAYLQGMGIQIKAKR